MDNVQEAEILTPLPRKQGESITMDFPSAIREIMSGKKVARVSWGNEDYGLLKDDWLSIYTKGKFHTWSVNSGDLEGEDWFVLKESN